MARLAGKVAVVTGAGSGIGRATAERFAAEGARVVCADISGGEEQVARVIGADAAAIRCDVSRSADVRAAIALAEEGFGGLDILVNNAGYSFGGCPLHEHDEEVFDRLVAVNLKGVYLGISHAVPAMTRRGGGAIVNVSSAAGLVGWKGLSVYSAAKGGIVMMTRSAALDYAVQGIRINAVCPGIVWTGMASQTSLRRPPAGREAIATVPMGRWGYDDEVAAAALFLASDEASFVTGTAMPVDGGYAAGGPGQGEGLRAVADELAGAGMEAALAEAG